VEAEVRWHEEFAKILAELPEHSPEQAGDKEIRDST
jgi:hypothetical protein